MKSMIQFAITNEEKKQLEKEAKQKGLSLSGYVRMIILERNK